MSAVLTPPDPGRDSGFDAPHQREIVMLYPTVLLQLDDDPHAGLRLARLLHIAAITSRHVVGMSPTRPAPGDGAGVLGLDVLTRELGAEARRAQARAHLFDSTCEGLRLRSHEVIEAAEEVGLALVDLARFSDLVLLQQPDPTNAGHAGQRAVLDEVLIHGCRPVLVVPHSGTFDRIGAKVLLAWDGSREAARAAADALAFLKRAKSVHVIAFDRFAYEDNAPSATILAPVREWLKRHEIEAVIETQAAAGSIGDSLLSRAFELGCDLLVMGAWGHSRLRERLLGGTTRTVIETMTVPVLFSH
jgi:nucleotide-binding universal stress UspA family protein